MKLIYKDDYVKLIQGDCLEVMDKMIEKGIKVDAIITDPPYGTTACSWDSVIPFKDMWERINNLIKDNGAICLFSSQPFTSVLVMSNLKFFKYEWVWLKSRAIGFNNAKNKPMSKHENILVFSKGTCANRSKKLMKYNPQGLIPFNKIVNGIKKK